MPTNKQNKPKNPHEGSSLDNFLQEEGIFEEVEAAALKRAVAMKLAENAPISSDMNAHSAT